MRVVAFLSCSNLPAQLARQSIPLSLTPESPPASSLLLRASSLCIWQEIHSSFSVHLEELQWECWNCVDVGGLARLLPIVGRSCGSINGSKDGQDGGVAVGAGIVIRSWAASAIITVQRGNYL